MQKSREQDAKSIFSKAIEFYEPHQWEGYIATACADDTELLAHVRELLDAHRRSDSFFDQDGRVTDMAVIERPGMLIGPFKLLQIIGEGGFGVVYMAEQTEPVRRKVALKIIKPGMDTKQVVARFEAERQALAMMDHPNIAKVLDAGSTESGRPYFVMELVKGVPITEFCDTNKLPNRERLELFRTVCHAIQHAHQKGVIHRDLKPTNVMVTLHDNKPMPVVIDFGVSKAISHQLTEKTLFTAYGQMVGTPAYMSPEQAQMSHMDIDTRSDVYSLGVLLYELLTGSTPLSAEELRGTAYAELQRRIREEEAPKPSTRLSTLGQALAKVAQDRSTDPGRLGQYIRGDLDWIVLKALDKERSRRYETANGLASDIQRFLDNEAVEACPPSLTYQARKFVGRNRGLVTTVSAVAVATLLGIIGTTIGMVRARHDANRANDALVEAKQARNDANVMAREKQQEAKAALLAKQEADRLRDDARVRSAQQLMMRAAAERERGDLTLAALLGTEALRQDGDDPHRASNYRRLVAADLRRCPVPTHILFRESKVVDARFSIDGKWIVSGCEDGTVAVFDAQSGELIRELDHEFPVTAVTFMMNDRRLLVSVKSPNERGEPFQSARYHLWDWQAEKQLHVSNGRRRNLSQDLQRRDYYVLPSSPKKIELISARDGSFYAPTLESKLGIDKVHIVESESPRVLFRTKKSKSDRRRPMGRESYTLQWEYWDPSTGRRENVGRSTVGSGMGFEQSVELVVAPSQYFAVGAYDQDIAVYNQHTMKEVNRIRTETQPMVGYPTNQRPIAFSPDGQVMVSGLPRGPKNFTLFSVRSGELLGKFKSGESMLTRIGGSMQMKPIFSPDNKQLLIVGLDGHLQILDVASQQPTTARLELSQPRDFRFSPDGRFVSAIGESGKVRIWNASSGELVAPEMKHSGQVVVSRFSPDGSHLLVAAGSQTYLWPVGLPRYSQVTVSLEQIGEAAANENPFLRAPTSAISPDGQSVVTTSARSANPHFVYAAHVWDAETGKRRLPPVEFPQGQFRFSPTPIFSSDGSNILFEQNAMTRGLRGDLGEQAEEESYPIFNVKSNQVCYLEPAAHWKIMEQGFSEDGTIVWARMFRESPTDTDENPDEPRFGSRIRRSFSGAVGVQVFSVQSGKPLGPPVLYSGDENFGSMMQRMRNPHLYGRTISLDGRHFVSVQRRDGVGLVQVRDLSTGEPIVDPLDSGIGSIRHLTFSPDDHYLFAVSKQQEGLAFRIWKTDEGFKLIKQAMIPIPWKRLSQIAVDPHGKRVLVYPSLVRSTSTSTRVSPANAGNWKRVIIYQVAEGRVRELHHDQTVQYAEFSSDGTHLLTTSADGIVRIWDPEGGTLLRTLGVELESLQDNAGFTRDGKRVITVQGRLGNSRTGSASPMTAVGPRMQIWDVATGQPVSMPLSLDRSFQLGQQNRRNIDGVINASADRAVTTRGNEIAIHDLSGDQRPVGDLLRVAQVLSGRRVNQTGSIETLAPELWRKQWEATADLVSEPRLPAKQGKDWHQNQIDVAETDAIRMWHIDRQIALAPSDPQHHQRRALTLARMERHEEATVAFEQCVKLGQPPHVQHGWSLVELGRWKEAAAQLETVRSDARENISQLRDRTSLRMRRGSRQANEQSPHLLGLAYLTTGDLESYDQYCERLLDNPQSIGARNRTQEVERLAQLCLMVPRSQAYCDRVNDFVRRSFAGRIPAQNLNRIGFVSTSRLANLLRDYRSGNAIAPRSTSRGSRERFQFQSSRLFVEAMAYQKEGDHAKAREALGEALSAFEAAQQSPNVSLFDKQIAVLLRKEAESVLAVAPPSDG